MVEDDFGAAVQRVRIVFGIRGVSGKGANNNIGFAPFAPLISSPGVLLKDLLK
jgi:hypothetical protein